MQHFDEKIEFSHLRQEHVEEIVVGQLPVAVLGQRQGHVAQRRLRHHQGAVATCVEGDMQSNQPHNVIYSILFYKQIDPVKFQ